MQMTNALNCPAHLILRTSRYVSIWRRPVSFSTVTVVICCSLTCRHWQPMIIRAAMLWNLASFALILFVSAQHSLPYSRIVSTHATYAALLASIEIFLFLKTSGFNFANALLADAILASTSASCPGSLSSIEPRYFALLTTGIVQLAMSLIVTLMSLHFKSGCTAH